MAQVKVNDEHRADEFYKRIIWITQTKAKLEPPEDLVETVVSFDLHESFKKQFVGFSAMLCALYKQKIRLQRKVNVNEIRAQPSSIKTPTKLNGSLCRVDFVPEVFKTCKSTAAKCAVAMFCLLPYKESIRRDVLFAILQDAFKSVDDIITLAKDNIKNIRDAVRNYMSCPDDVRKMLIQAILRTSDVLRDKSYSKLAMSVQPDIYLLAVRHYVKNSSFSTMCPYDALVNTYVQTCIASKSQASERLKIANQFDVNASAIVENMINGLANDNDAVKSVKFEEGQTYYVFEGPINFPRDLTFSYREYKGEHYQIVTYKDCLYDVIGTDDRLFSDKTWRERLDAIDYTAKIIIRKKTGAELNGYNGNATLATSWMDKNRFHCKHFTFVKREGKKNK